MSRCPAQRKVEIGWHDSNHQAIVAVELDVTSDEIAIGIESSCPEPVAQDCFLCMADLILLGKNVSPQPRSNSERREQARRHSHSIESLGRSGRVACKIEKSVAIHSYRFKRARPADDLLRIVPEGEVCMHLRRIGISELSSDLNELFGMGVGEGIDQHRLDCRKDYCRRSYAERGRQQSNGGYRRCPPQKAQGEPNVFED